MVRKARQAACLRVWTGPAVYHCIEYIPRTGLNRHRLEGFLCDEARYIIGRGGRKVGADGHDSRRRKVDPMACVECQSPCGYGLRYLTLLTPEERKEYRCGGDCAECPQPCNLYRAMRAEG